MNIHGIEIDDFTFGYLVCALWSSTHPDFQTDRETEDTPETLYGYDVEDFDKESIELAAKVCTRFKALAGDLLLERESYNPHEGTILEHAGHDFWLTHNGHGAGFWDGRYPEDIGEKLTELCKGFIDAHIDVYTDKDGKEKLNLLMM